MPIKIFRRIWRRAALALLSWRSPPIVILMRYSILQAPENGGKAWRIGRDTDIETTRAKLFDDKRLEQRLLSLQRLVLPSLQKQTVPLNPRQHRLVVITSQSLPPRHMQALREALTPYPWARIETCPIEERANHPAIVSSFLRETKARKGVVVTSRLDDDDALGKQYIERLIIHARPEREGHAVTFPSGYIGMYDADAGRFLRFVKTNSPFTAQGLACIESFDGTDFKGRTVYGLGNHRTVGERHPFILDDSFVAFVRSTYLEQDTGGRDGMKRAGAGPKVARRIVLRHVGLQQ